MVFKLKDGGGGCFAKRLWMSVWITDSGLSLRNANGPSILFDNGDIKHRRTP